MGTLRDAWVAQMHQVPNTTVEHVDQTMVVLRLTGTIRPVQALIILEALKQTEIVWQGPDFLIVRWKMFDGIGF